MELKTLEKISQEIRLEILEMVHISGSSHVGSAFSITDILVFLYFYLLNYEYGDKVILSKGHATAALYAVLKKKKLMADFKPEDFCADGSILCGHASRNASAEIFVSSGSLGHGLPLAVGSALASYLDQKRNRIYCLMGDGECNEGSIWEAANFAQQHKLNNLVAIIDYNKLQGFGAASEIMNMEPFKAKWEAFNWQAIECDGHNFFDLAQAFGKITGQAPSVIIAKTIKGKGVSFMENSLHWHYGSPNDDQYRIAKEEILKS
ncbi:MAG TPA: transketolase [Candidatus Pacearchaeota archaeon]|nr:transketolase [Candidatus Pacearchaeota archaeon]